MWASVDGDGFIDIWDINKDTESPLVHKKAFENNQQSSSAYKEQDDQRALISLKWSRDGRRIAIGDSDGFVSVWQADKELYMPKQSDFDKIEDLLQRNSSEATQKKGKGYDADYD